MVLALTHHIADILSTALKGMRLPLIVDANKKGLSPSGCGTAIVIDLLISAVLLLLLLISAVLLLLLLISAVLLLLLHLER